MSDDTNLLKRELWESLHEKRDRDAFVASHLSGNIGAQIFSMREARGWSQGKLAEEVGMAQPRISVLEGGYDSYSLTTLKRLASAFDVAVVVRFVPFSELVDWVGDLSEERLAPAEFANDNLAIDAVEEEVGYEAAVPEPSLVLYGSAEDALPAATMASLDAAYATLLDALLKLKPPMPARKRVWGSSFYGAGGGIVPGNILGSNTPGQGIGFVATPHHGKLNQAASAYAYGLAMLSGAGSLPLATVRNDLEQHSFYVSSWNVHQNQGEPTLIAGQTISNIIINIGETAYETDFQASGLLNTAGFAGRGHASGWISLSERDRDSEGDLQVYGIS